MKSKFPDFNNPSNNIIFNNSDGTSNVLTINDSNSCGTLTLGTSSIVTFSNPSEAHQMAMIVRSNDVGALREAIKCGFKLLCLDPADQNTLNSIHAINYAAYFNRVGILKYLVEELKIDLSIKHSGHTAIYCAIINQCLEALQYLIGHDNINAIPQGYSGGSTPLQFAAENGFKAGVKLLIENGANCNGVFHHRASEDILDLIKFGSFVQSLCSGSKAVYGTDEVITKIIAKSENSNSWMEFAIASMKSYALKVELSKNCLTWIKTCNVFPEKFKDCLFEAIFPIFNETQEAFDSLDAELFYLGGLIDCPVSYSEVNDPTTTRSEDTKNDKPIGFSTFYNENVPNDQKTPYVLSDPNEFNDIKNAYELFENYKQKGFCVLHFARTQLSENLSLLAGFMLAHPQIKDSVDLLLGQSIPQEVRKLLTTAVKQFQDLKLSEAKACEMIEEFQLSSPNLFYPITKQQVAEEKRAIEEKIKSCLTFYSDSTSDSIDDVESMGEDWSDSDLYG